MKNINMNKTNKNIVIYSCIGCIVVFMLIIVLFNTGIIDNNFYSIIPKDIKVEKTNTNSNIDTVSVSDEFSSSANNEIEVLKLITLNYKNL